MKVHPIIANPRTMKPGKWNESESSLNEFAFSAIALAEMKEVMKKDRRPFTQAEVKRWFLGQLNRSYIN